MTKNKLVFLAAAISLVSSAAVFALERGHECKKGAPATEYKEVTTQAAKKGRAVKMKTVRTSALDARTRALESEVRNLRVQVSDLRQQQDNTRHVIFGDKPFAYGPVVVTTPIIGEPNYSGYDLYINFPSTNDDLALLKLNQKIENYYAENNIPRSTRPVVAFSGEIDGEVLSSSAFNTGSESDINLSTVALEAVVTVNSWVSGLIKFEYDDSSPETGARVTNSALKVKKAYVTFGNLNRFPLYVSLGAQMYVPFGVYSSWMNTTPLTSTLGKTEERPIVVGFYKNGLYASGYVFQGDTHTGNSSSINSWGTNLGYKYILGDKGCIDFGGGYIANLADSLGMQDNGADGIDTFNGFKFHERIHDQVPAANAHLLINYNPISVVAEYIAAIDKFNDADLTFNGDGAQPRALDVEAIYDFTAFCKPAYISAGFGESWESLGLNMPKYSYYVATGISLFRNTVQSIEYRHDINYDRGDVATGPNLSGTGTLIPGRHQRNMVTANFKLFF